MGYFYVFGFELNAVFVLLRLSCKLIPDTTGVVHHFGWVLLQYQSWLTPRPFETEFGFFNGVQDRRTVKERSNFGFFFLSDYVIC